MVSIVFDNLLDVRGDTCPLPSLKSKKILKSMEPGSVLKVITDHEPATRSVPGYIEKMHHKYLGLVEEFNEDSGEIKYWTMYFRRRANIFR